MRALLVLVALCLLSAVPAQATVYSWRDAAGTAHFTNDEEAVPDRFRSEAERFTAPTVTPPAESERGPAVLPRKGPPRILGFQRGLRAGFRAAENQTRAVGEAIRDALSALPPPAVFRPDPMPAFVPRGGRFGTPFTFLGPASPHCFAPYGYVPSLPALHLHGRRLTPHSHFFPGSGRVRSGFFFPYGHFTHQGFITGTGVYVP